MDYEIMEDNNKFVEFNNRYNQTHVDFFKDCSDKIAFLETHPNFISFLYVNNYRELIDNSFKEIENFSDIILLNNDYILIIIADYGDLDLLKIVERSENFNLIKLQKVLSRASFMGSTNIVKYLYPKDPKCYYISYASHHGHVDILEFILEEIEKTGKIEYLEVKMACEVACQNGNFDFLKVIVDRDFFIHHHIESVRCCFTWNSEKWMYYCGPKNLECLKLVLPIIDVSLLSLIFNIIFRIENEEIIDIFLNYLDPNTRDYEGNNLLYYCVKFHSHENLPKFWKICDPNNFNHKGLSVIHNMLKRRNCFLTYFEDKRINFKIKSVNGNNYLHYTIMFDSSIEKILFLLNHIDPNEPNDFGYTPLHLSIMNGREIISEILFPVTDLYKIHQYPNYGCTILLYFIKNKQYIFVNQIINFETSNNFQKFINFYQDILFEFEDLEVGLNIFGKLVDLNFKDSDGYTLIMRTILKCASNRKANLKSLMNFAKKNKINLLNDKSSEIRGGPNNKTVFEIAETLGNIEIIQILKSY